MNDLIEIAFTNPVEGDTKTPSSGLETETDFTYSLDNAITTDGPQGRINAKVKLPAIDGKARSVRLFFSPEARNGFSKEYSLRHGVMYEERKNADGKWSFRLLCSADTVTGHITVTGLSVIRTVKN